MTDSVKPWQDKLSGYNSWVAMKQRCHNPNTKKFETYGARGIAVCTRWRESFSNFLEDMGRRPSTNHSVERIDNDGNYEPSNCRWATPKQQANNTRRNRFVTLNGETRTLANWSSHFGKHPDCVRYRVDHRGWSVEKALEITA